jgi:ABC-type phosphate transport system substrate-binding protein
MKQMKHLKVVGGMKGWRLRAVTILVCLLVASWPSTALTQSAPDIAVVVNRDLPVDTLPLTELRRMLLGDREFWSSGLHVTLLIRAPIARERDAAVKTVCDMSEAQFRQHWIAKVFRAESAAGPKIVYSNESAIDTVGRTPGAIAFVEATAVTKNVKVLKIDGLAPGQAGYKIK